MNDDDKGWTMLAGEIDTENERLRLALATMAARERETSAERDALRTMLAEARERASVPCDARLSRLTALMLRVAARRDQLTSELSVVTGQRDAALEIIAGRAVAPTWAEIIAHCYAGGAWLVVDARKRVLGSPFSASAKVIEEPAATVHDDPIRCLAWMKEGHVLRVIPLDRNRRPCAWPTTGDE